MRNYFIMEQAGGRRSGETLLYILKVEFTRIATRIGCERKREVKDDCIVFDLSKDVVAIF